MASAMEDEKARVRTQVFTDLTGIVLAPTVNALADRGVLKLFGAPRNGSPSRKLRITRAPMAVTCAWRCGCWSAAAG